MAFLTAMLYDIGDQLSAVHNCPEHFGNWLLGKGPVLLSFHRQTDIDRTALGRYDLCTQARLGQENLAKICGIDLDGRRGAGNL